MFFEGCPSPFDESGLTLAENDEIKVKLILAPVTATFDAASYAADEGVSVEVTMKLGGSMSR